LCDAQISLRRLATNSDQEKLPRMLGGGATVA
jgi:hypothetical protein